MILLSLEFCNAFKEIIKIYISLAKMGEGEIMPSISMELLFPSRFFFFALKTYFGAYYFNPIASVREMFSSLIYRWRNTKTKKFK